MWILFLKKYFENKRESVFVLNISRINIYFKTIREMVIFKIITQEINAIFLAETIFFMFLLFSLEIL